MEILTFRLSDGIFGISIECVEAIEHIAPITYIPKAREHIRGLMNIRGNIIPVVDMTKLLKLNKESAKNKLILIRHNNQQIALLVDDVDDVINVNEDNIKTISIDKEKLSIIDYQNITITFIDEEQLNLI